MSTTLNLKLKVWRQESADDVGAFEYYDVAVADDASFLEMSTKA